MSSVNHGQDNIIFDTRPPAVTMLAEKSLSSRRNLLRMSRFYVRGEKAALSRSYGATGAVPLRFRFAKHELNGDRDVDLSADACRPGRDCHAFCRRRRLSATSPPLSALGAPSCGVSCCSFPDGAEPAFDRGRQLFLRAGAHPARPRRRIAAGIAMRSRHCSRRRRCGSPQQFSGTSRSAAQGPRAADSPLEGGDFELSVPLPTQPQRGAVQGRHYLVRRRANQAACCVEQPSARPSMTRGQGGFRHPDRGAEGAPGVLCGLAVRLVDNEAS